MSTECVIIYKCSATDNIMKQKSCQFYDKSPTSIECLYQNVYNNKVHFPKYMCSCRKAHINSLMEQLYYK